MDASPSKSCLKAAVGAKRPALGPGSGAASTQDADSGDVGAVMAAICAKCSQSFVLKTTLPTSSKSTRQVTTSGLTTRIQRSISWVWNNDQRKLLFFILRKDFDVRNDEIGQLRKTLALDAARPRSKSV